MHTINKIKWIGCILLISVIADHAYGQFSMNATTNDAIVTGATPFVVLTWNDETQWDHFNLYRKTSTQSTYPEDPINGATPIQAMTDCQNIQSVIPQNTEEWNILEAGLSVTSGTQTTMFDPCAISTVTPASASQYQKLQFMVRSRWKIAVVAGQGYQDYGVSTGTTYDYQLVGTDSLGAEQDTLDEVQITAGQPDEVSPPDGNTLSAQAGDNQVLVTWGDVPEAAGFVVYRATDANGNYQRINNTTFLSRIQYDLDQNPIQSTNGFIDFQRYDSNGLAVAHTVQGVSITGPINSVGYFYKVSAVDILGNEGPITPAFTNANPQDTTVPQVPEYVEVIPNNTLNQLKIRWDKVLRDVEGHFEKSIQGYQVLRYENPNGASTQVAFVPQPASGISYVTAVDSDPILLPQYGEKIFWYRIKAVDANGNIGRQSSSSSGNLDDLTPPSVPGNLQANGTESTIAVTWDINTEPDMDGYLIYRSLCHMGFSPCNPELLDPVVGVPSVGDLPDPEECKNHFSLIGYVSQDEAEEIAGGGSTVVFEDTELPDGSPVCYGYLVKAHDKAQNTSGDWPPAPPEYVVCEKLRETTPPDPAVITSLTPRDRAIEVEWVGPPVQDIAAYHVFRSQQENNNYQFIGGLKVNINQPNTTINNPYTPPETVDCSDIPIDTNEQMSIGTFVDSSVNPKENYFYKVIGIDQKGNPTNPEETLQDAAPVSTFTYTTQNPTSPEISNVSIQQPTCVIEIDWTPQFDATNAQGFVVFRSQNQNGPYTQVSPLLQTSRYVDSHISRGLEYWYRVMKIDIQGDLSPMSQPANGIVQNN